MNTLRRVLAWEIIGFSPEILYILEATSSVLQTSFNYDLSYFHYFLEQNYELCDIRSNDYAQ